MSTLILIPSVFEAERLDVEARSVESAVTVAGDRIVRCGVGIVVAALSARLMLAVGRWELCLLAGLAGTRDPTRAPVGSLVAGVAVCNEAIGAGQGRGFLALGEMGFGPGETAPDLLELASTPRVQGEVRGVIGTVAAASATPDQAAGWRARHPDVLVEEMEGYGVALACRQAGVPLAILRAVSNLAGDRDRSRWDFQAAFAALRQGLQPFLPRVGRGSDPA